MEITYELKITNMNCYRNYETVTMLVFDVQWIYKGTNGEYSSFITGRTNIPYDTNSEYKQYQDLTEEEVLSWIREYEDDSIFSEAETEIADQIDRFTNPPILNPKLPWDNS